MNDVKKYTDAEIIEKILAGDTALFEILIRRNNPFIYKTGRSFHFNHDDTLDLMQDSFINAFVHLSKFEHRSSFKTWLIKIMLHNCYKKKHKLSFKNEKALEINEKSTPMFSNKPTNVPSSIMINRELNFVIEDAVHQLQEEYRMVFSLREMSGLSVKETAAALGITEVNVKVRLSRAKTMLRAIIEKAYMPEEIFEFNLIYCDAMVDNVMHKINELNKKDQ